MLDVAAFAVEFAVLAVVLAVLATPDTLNIFVFAVLTVLDNEMKSALVANDAVPVVAYVDNPIIDDA